LSDKASLVRHANNPRIWRNVRDAFPHPYTDADAEAFIAGASSGRDWAYAIEVNGEAAGGIGIHRREDVERYSVEMGYWLGETLWGRGIATAAVQTLSQYILRNTEIFRIYAYVYAWNPASIRVLEKAGFEREAILRRSVVKDGVVLDRALYALTRDPGWPYQRID
jgi:RimJ/RimL family protein N-acetyltransferase